MKRILQGIDACFNAAKIAGKRADDKRKVRPPVILPYGNAENDGKYVKSFKISFSVGVRFRFRFSLLPSLQFEFD